MFLSETSEGHPCTLNIVQFEREYGEVTCEYAFESACLLLRDQVMKSFRFRHEVKGGNSSTKLEIVASQHLFEPEIPLTS